MIKPPDHDQVFAPGQDFVNRGVLPGQANDLAHLLRATPDVNAANVDFAFVRLEQGGEYAYQRGLAGAVRSQQTEHFAVLGGDRHAVQRFDIAKSACRHFPQR